MQKIYLKVPFREKDDAKSLGARFDWDAKLWYVHQGTDLNLFARWLNDDLLQNLQLSVIQEDNIAPSNTKLATKDTPISEVQHTGISLSQLLSNIASVVHQVYSQGVWTVVEIIEIHARGHLYLEVSERDENNRQLAKARAMIWQSTAEKILPEFEQATGATIGAGIKLLVLAVPKFHSQYGFSLQIEAIDAKYTLGYLEAKRREIRARLHSEGVFDNNRNLDMPWDFNSVLVLAPHQAAGLGDFQQEAQRLQSYGICSFHYANSRFQGEGAATEIANAMESALQELANNPPDVIVIIRGGGSVSDLAWLDDYDLSRAICDLNIPVFTGIGHQRDNTIIDEVAHTKFDTPSKVISGIEQRIIQRVNEAKDFIQKITEMARQEINEARRGCMKINNIVVQAKHSYLHARNTINFDIKQIVDLVISNKHQAKKSTLDTFTRIFDSVENNIFQSRKDLSATIKAISELAQANKEQSSKVLNADFRYLIEQIYNILNVSKINSQSLMQEIVGQGPDKTLKRGFAIIRDAENNTVTNKQSAALAKKLKIEFKDGEVAVNID